MRFRDYFDDTEPKKLARADASKTSKKATAKVKSGSWKAKCYEYIHAAGKEGATPKQVLKHYESVCSYSTVTARFADLKRDGLLVPTGREIDGSEVLVASEFL